LDGFLRSWIAEEKNHKILMFGLPDLLFLYCRHYRICQSASILRQVERN
jgi:hypothetical protein